MKSILVSVWDKIHPVDVQVWFTSPWSEAHAQNAVRDAQTSLDMAKGNREAISKRVEALRSQREKNHFAELIQVTMRGNG